MDFNALLDEAVIEAALESGTGASLLAARMGVTRTIAAGNRIRTAGQQNNHHSNAWLPAEDAYVEEMLPQLGIEETAARIGRSVNAVKVRYTRAGIPGVLRTPDWITGHLMAISIGVDGHSITRLIELGRLPAELAPLRNRLVWRMRRSAWYAWVLNPNHWPYFYRSVRDPSRIRDEKLRRMLIRRAERWGDEWWTIGEVARYHGVGFKSVNQRIARGQVWSAVRWGNWLIRRSEAVQMEIRPGMGSAKRHSVFTAAGDAFIVLAHALGIPDNHISRMIRMSSGFFPYRYAVLQQDLLIPHIIRQFDMPVAYRESDQAMWTDWRPYARRFPVLAAAWEKWESGSRLALNERHTLVGCLAQAVAWQYGPEPADPDLRRLLVRNGPPPNDRVLAAGVVVWREVTSFERRLKVASESWQKLAQAEPAQ